MDGEREESYNRTLAFVLDCVYVRVCVCVCVCFRTRLTQ